MSRARIKEFLLRTRYPRPVSLLGRIVKMTTPALLLIGIAGCSFVTMFYGQLPRLATSWVDDAFDLSREQERNVRKQFDQVFAWHGSVEVPRLVAFLAKAEQLLAEENGLSAQDVQILAEDFWQFRDALFDQVYSRSFPILNSLFASQIETCRAFLSKQNKKRFKELDAGVAEYSESYVDRWEDRIDDWTGSLSRTQLDLIKADATASFARQSEHRQQLLVAQGEFLKILTEIKAHGETGFAQELWKITPAVKGTDRYQATVTLLTGIAAQLTEKQITHLKGELRKWKGRLQGIATTAG
jgi:hypothetical protein